MTVPRFPFRQAPKKGHGRPWSHAGSDRAVFRANTSLKRRGAIRSTSVLRSGAPALQAGSRWPVMRRVPLAGEAGTGRWWRSGRSVRWGSSAGGTAEEQPPTAACMGTRRQTYPDERGAERGRNHPRRQMRGAKIHYVHLGRHSPPSETRRASASGGREENSDYLRHRSRRGRSARLGGRHSTSCSRATI